MCSMSCMVVLFSLNSPYWWATGLKWWVEVVTRFMWWVEVVSRLKGWGVGGGEAWVTNSVSHLLSVISCLPSSVYHLLSPISCLPSPVCHFLSSISSRLNLPLILHKLNAFIGISVKNYSEP